ncbi:hypothetical protein [Pseudomonas sp. OHS18]|uniref:hypothetical protein n=1 Tax=Pseudomonas sp. OHS18 TaxID=3399679 RepID=UPI003A892948
MIEQEPVKTDNFESWLAARPKWLQTAARMMIDAKRQLHEGEIKELSRLCQIEVEGKPDSGFLTIVPGTLSQAAARPSVRIDEILDIHGLNAIKAGANLPFGNSNLAVIYGQNGTGKSGFARLLKQVCGSRSKDEIRSNVFEPTPIECRARFKVLVGGNPVDVNWDISSGPYKALRQAQVFDSRAAQQYMGRTEACYEPSSMKFVSALIAISDAVSAELSREKELLKGLFLHSRPLSSTNEAKWLQTLKSTTATSSIDKECFYTEELDRERIEKESLLAEKNISGRLQTIGKEKTALKSIEMTMSSLQLGSTDAVALELVDLTEIALKARKISEEAAAAIFGKVELEGVGSATWQQMWERARVYSATIAYPQFPFPNISLNSRCVLCHQNLDDAAKARLDGFEKFVTDGLEKAAKKAEIVLADRKLIIPSLPSQADWLVCMSTLGFEQEDAESWLSTLKTRLELLTKGTPFEVQQPFDWFKINEAIKKKSSTLASEEASLAALQTDEHRQAMQLRVLALQAKQWLSQNKSSIITEKNRLTALALLDKASRSTATNSLTAKKNELAKTELDAGYQTRFVNELKLLGGHRIPVSPQSKSGGKEKSPSA